MSLGIPLTVWSGYTVVDKRWYPWMRASTEMSTFNSTIVPPTTRIDTITQMLAPLLDNTVWTDTSASASIDSKTGAAIESRISFALPRTQRTSTLTILSYLRRLLSSKLYRLTASQSVLKKMDDLVTKNLARHLGVSAVRSQGEVKDAAENLQLFRSKFFFEADLTMEKALPVAPLLAMPFQSTFTNTSETAFSDHAHGTHN
ncbi:unnamed protein product [Nippostrongylus brasiliensis]|uniref:Uncharacterized protein n=1 Tax=Nippostrongylus brasiliensis TaxID=27835 RepID=A0A0N4YBH5_NIPBR|nr:hypothetical protein Q1695_015733 [Nippostrongylus brasiliensis]VDL77402.1 unnamed protein product [Nippostrongylus brasiliensis]